MVVSNKVSIGNKDFKYFIGHKNATKLDLYHTLSENECI